MTDPVVSAQQALDVVACDLIVNRSPKASLIHPMWLWVENLITDKAFSVAPPINDGDSAVDWNHYTEQDGGEVPEKVRRFYRAAADSLITLGWALCLVRQDHSSPNVERLIYSIRQFYADSVEAWAEYGDGS